MKRRVLTDSLNTKKWKTEKDDLHKGEGKGHEERCWPTELVEKVILSKDIVRVI